MSEFKNTPAPQADRLTALDQDIAVLKAERDPLASRLQVIDQQLSRKTIERNRLRSADRMRLMSKDLLLASLNSLHRLAFGNPLPKTYTFTSPTEVADHILSSYGQSEESLERINALLTIEECLATASPLQIEMATLGLQNRKSATVERSANGDAKETFRGMIQATEDVRACVNLLNNASVIDQLTAPLDASALRFVYTESARLADRVPVIGREEPSDPVPNGEYRKAIMELLIDDPYPTGTLKQILAGWQKRLAADGQKADRKVLDELEQKMEGQ